MLFRTPLAPLVVGGSLDLVGGYATQALMAVIYATSIVCWTRTALAFGRRAALVTAAALLLYPGYGILFHMLSSDSICAFVFAIWALALTRASLEPTTGRFALLGLATAAAALTRPGYQVLAVFALLPLVLRLPWRGVSRRRRRSSASSWDLLGAVDREQRCAVRRLCARARRRRVLPVLSRVHHRSDRLARERRGLAGAGRRGSGRICSTRSRTARTGSHSNGSSRKGALASSRTSSGSPIASGDGRRTTRRCVRWASRRSVHTRGAYVRGVDRHGSRRALEPSARCAPARGLRRDGGRQTRMTPSAVERSSASIRGRADPIGSPGVLLDDAGRHNHGGVEVSDGSLPSLLNP